MSFVCIGNSASAASDTVSCKEVASVGAEFATKMALSDQFLPAFETLADGIGVVLQRKDLSKEAAVPMAGVISASRGWSANPREFERRANILCASAAGLVDGGELDCEASRRSAIRVADLYMLGFDRASVMEKFSPLLAASDPALRDYLFAVLVFADGWAGPSHEYGNLISALCVGRKNIAPE